MTALAAAVLVSPAACDPCSGLLQCGNGPYLAVTGQIVDRLSGRPVSGARIDVVRTGGAAVTQDSLSTTTTQDGFWRTELAPTGDGSVSVDIEVSPPNAAPYRVRGVPVTTRPHRGDASLNETWVSEPYFSYAGELFLRGTGDERVKNRPVEFRVTGGVSTRGTGIRDSVYRATTDAAGRVELFPQREDGGVLPVGGDVLAGDLLVHLLTGDVTVRGVRLVPSHVYFGTVDILRLEVGP